MTDRPGDEIRILHVDDDAELVELVADLLEREIEGFTVETATSAAEGLQALGETDVDCVVSDYEMPGRNGIEFVHDVRDRHPGLPFVLFTGKGSEEIASEAVSAGITDYLQKGSGSDRYTLLANRIENAVERHRSQRALERRKRRLETLISNLPGVVYRCHNDPSWPMEYVEGECRDLFGYPASAFEDGDVDLGTDVIHPGDRDDVWTAVQAALDAGDPFEVTYRIRRADGTTRVVWERGRGIARGADGAVDTGGPDDSGDTVEAGGDGVGDDGDGDHDDGDHGDGDDVQAVVAIEGFITDVTEREDDRRVPE